ncbi:MAG: DUF3540 domain-containing protein [Deltaproteobacteria bacterium]|nr:DUF3540 domain-containing protein [Deltaproteobacteria bacterium]
MDNLAKELRPEETRLGRALVRRTENGACLVEEPGGLTPARLAAGCLLAPRTGDTVLVAWTGPEAYVLSVLERGAPGPDRLETTGDLELASRQGEVRISAAKGVEAVTPGKLSLTAPHMELAGLGLQIKVERVTFFGRLLQAKVAQVKLAAASVDTAVRRVTQKLGDCFRWVEGSDHLHAGQVSREVEGLYAMNTRYSIITADEDVKVDARHIHLG